MGAASSAPLGKSVSLVWQQRSGVGETGVRGARTMASDAGGGKTNIRDGYFLVFILSREQSGSSSLTERFLLVDLLSLWQDDTLWLVLLLECLPLHAVCVGAKS